MTATFVDTSGLYALLDVEDPTHPSATARFGSLDGPLLTHSYVLVESAALVRNRLGHAAARDLLEELTQPLEVVWVDEALHRRAVAAFVASPSRGPSLVDQVSFEVMRSRGITTAFAFDRHFTDAGFELARPPS